MDHEDRRSAGFGPVGLLATGAALGVGVWAWAQVTRHPPDSAPGRTARRMRFGRYVVQGRTVTINASRNLLWAFWRDPANLSRFLRDVTSCEDLGEGRARWTLQGPDGAIYVETRLVEDREGESLAWRSTGNSDLDIEAKVRFRDAPAGRGTELEAHIAYKPSGGFVGQWAAKLARTDPLARGRQELKRLKMLIETGEIATAANRRIA